MTINENTKLYVVDIETDAIDATKIRCMSFCNVKDGVVKTITNYEIIKKFFLQENSIVIGHNFIRYDSVQIEKLLNIEIKLPIIDTLAIAWIIDSDKKSVGLGAYGEMYGVPKPIITDYANQDIKDVIHRCEQDVLINLKLWNNQKWYLEELYDSNWDDICKYLTYLEFKLTCVKKQELIGVKLDISLIKETLMELEQLKLDKIEALTKAMPQVPIKAKKEMPKVLRKSDGSLSANGYRWYDFLKENNLPETHTEPVEYIKGYSDPNPNSHSQIKDWLFSLKWTPGWFKYVKEEGSREMRKIPQIASKDEPGEVCESIKKLIEKEPNIEELSGLGIISHRIGILKGFLRDQKEGRLYQGTSNLTNTLRLCHTKICNLPSTDKPYSENIRKAIIPDEGYLIGNTDLSSVENNTKLHYLYKYDKEYVLEQMSEGFDAHLDLAITAGFLTKEQAENHKKGLENHKLIRQKAKTSNYALTYGCGIDTLARQGDMSKKEAKILHEAYWKRNDSITKASKSFLIKQIGTQMWILNPVSKFWYSLRNDKDKFATVNSSTAVYFFDIWVKYLIENNLIPITQTHDEVNLLILPEDKEKTTKLIQKAIDKANAEINLNVKIGFSIAYGNSYGEVH